MPKMEIVINLSNHHIHVNHEDLEVLFGKGHELTKTCLLYTSDAADDLLCVDLGGRRIIKKTKLI